MDGDQLTLDDELTLAEGEDETWEAWWASLPRIPGEPPPQSCVPEEEKVA